MTQRAVPRIHRLRGAWLAGGLVLAGALAYCNVYGNQFLWDDEFNIQRNTYITSFAHLPEVFTSSGGAGAGRLDNFYRPVKLVVYTAIHALFGLRPWAFHLLNVLLHLANALLLFALLKAIFRRELVAFSTALLWVVHPIHTEAITYTSGTQDPLALCFGLAAFWSYVQFRRRPQRWRLILSLAAFLLGLLSKESIIILPGLIVLYEVVVAERPGDWRQYRWVALMAALAVGYFLLRLTVLNFGGTLNMYRESNIYTQSLAVRVYTFLAVLWPYYAMLLYPVGLHMERQFSVFPSLFHLPVLASLTVLIGSLAVAIRQRSVVLFGVGWFLIAFIPMSGLIPVNSLLQEHWLYVPSVGLFLLAAWLGRRLWPLLWVIVPLCIGLTLHRNTDWKDPITFYNTILAHHGGTARVHNNLAMAYADTEEFTLAHTHYVNAIELSDTYPQTHYNLARLYVRSGQIQTAIEHLTRSLEINPDFFYASRLLGQLYEAQGDHETAQAYYQQAERTPYYR